MPVTVTVGEFLHMGVVLGDKTLFHELHRAPFDGYLTPDEAGELDRFVYEEREMDYASELADRMQRAIRLRSRQPGKKGLLLSAGYDRGRCCHSFPTSTTATPSECRTHRR
ncbi:hypothetical protein [Haladaptatus sp. W1]|uniref:hypothetical protein n=1 Tax=Haladaptatus sp. W1 TaxID=1897478 RepID=UPI0020C765E9|nr:hypothetical protein [Haladaptatus sp. W1]